MTDSNKIQDNSNTTSERSKYLKENHLDCETTTKEPLEVVNPKRLNLKTPEMQAKIEASHRKMVDAMIEGIAEVNRQHNRQD